MATSDDDHDLTDGDADTPYDGVCPICNEAFTDHFQKLDEGTSIEGVRVCVLEKDADEETVNALYHLPSDQEHDLLPEGETPTLRCLWCNCPRSGTDSCACDDPVYVPMAECDHCDRWRDIHNLAPAGESQDGDVVCDAACAMTDGGTSTGGTDHWQVVEITGVGLGEMWFDIVADDLSRDDAENRASRQRRHVAVPMPYSPNPPAGVGERVDDYEREVVKQ